MQRRALLASTGCALTAGLAGCLDSALGVSETESFERSYDATDGTVLSATNRNGDVTVRETGGEQLSVSGQKRASTQSGLEEITVDVAAGERLTVEGRFGPGSAFTSRSVDLVVEVPAGVTVDGVATANGDVTVEDVAGDVSAVTENGDVTVSGVDGYVQCNTTNGDVRARGTRGLTWAQTSNGAVDVEVLRMREDVTCRSTNGSVTVRVGSDVTAAIRLTTSRGDADVRDLEYTTSTSRGNHIEGQLRGATEPLLRAESSNGDVTLRPATE
jgi:DUF4097 and DUF4098 domain-containing protein YvlB